MPAARKPPMLDTAIAIPAFSGGFTSFAIAHESVKHGTTSPVNSAAIAAAPALGGGNASQINSVILNAMAPPSTIGRRTRSRSDSQPTAGTQQANPINV